MKKSVLFVAATVFHASSASAEILQLVCEYGQGGTTTFTIDMDRKTIQEGANDSCKWTIDGKVYEAHGCPALGRAQIDERTISWNTTSKEMTGAAEMYEARISGSIDRLSGNFWLKSETDRRLPYQAFGKCHRGAQQF